MTKEEYERLLQSEYWKGYSFSLIKERNFTCEDCGRSFPGERQKLQVHHLTYRDVAPWSYRPEELIVLCRECHQRRHGIYQPDAEDIPKTNIPTEEGKYCKSYDIPKELKVEYMRDPLDAIPPVNDELLPKREDLPAEFAEDGFGHDLEPSRNNQARYIALGCIASILLPGLVVLIIMFIVIFGDGHKSSLPEIDMHYSDGLIDSPDRVETTPSKSTRQTKKAESYEEDGIKTEYLPEPTLTEPLTFGEVVNKSHAESPKTENKREKSTLELLEEKTHKSVVERAKREGVSTEGSTSDILDRLTHKSVVERAKREGVSTEGSTTDILDRLTHKSVVERAKREGVSTEGSTSDILDRLTRKHLNSE